MTARIANLRIATPEDLPFMWEMLAVAAYSDRETVTRTPELSRYLDVWGRDGDLGFVSIDETGGRSGAAWIRLMTADEPGYGFVSEEIPELAIGVCDGLRGAGVGSALLGRLISEVGTSYPAISLSVRRENPAFYLYRRFGFEVVEVDRLEDEFTMKRDSR